MEESDLQDTRMKKNAKEAVSTTAGEGTAAGSGCGAEAVSLPPVFWEAGRLDGRDQREDLIHSVVGLADGGLPVSVWPSPVSGVPAGESDEEFFSRLSSLCGGPPEARRYVSIQHADPRHLQRDDNAEYCIGRTAVGTVPVARDWARAAASLDEIWAPSTFSRTALAASGVGEEMIQVIPSSIDAESYRPAAASLADERGGGFAFLTVLDWDYARGLDIVLEAYVREFRKSEDVVLVLRAAEGPSQAVACAGGEDMASFWRELEAWLHGRLRGRGDGDGSSKGFEAVLGAVRGSRLRDELRREHEVEISMAAEIEEVVRAEMKGRESGVPAVKVVSRTLPRKLLPGLYSACDAFVMAPRAERWGRPFLESMAAGLPTIGTKWGGHLDFMRPDNSYLISVRALVEVPGDDGSQRSGMRLAEPDVEHLRELMRRVFEHRSEARERAAGAAAYVRSKHSLRQVASLMARRLADIAGDSRLDFATAA